MVLVNLQLGDLLRRDSSSNWLKREDRWSPVETQQSQRGKERGKPRESETMASSILSYRVPDDSISAAHAL